MQKPASTVRACAVFGLNSDTAVSTISFCFLSSALLSFFFLLLLGIYSATVGNDFGKAFRKEEIDGRKCAWGIKRRFWQNFRVNFILSFVFFAVFLAELCSFWYGFKDLFLLHK